MNKKRYWLGEQSIKHTRKKSAIQLLWMGRGRRKIQKLHNLMFGC